MAAHQQDPGSGTAAVERWRLFHDLRRRNERRADVARMLEAKRQQRIERVMQVARQRRFRKNP
jgi:hypothetical protein